MVHNIEMTVCKNASDRSKNELEWLGILKMLTYKQQIKLIDRVKHELLKELLTENTDSYNLVILHKVCKYIKMLDNSSLNRVYGCIKTYIELKNEE